MIKLSDTLFLDRDIIKGFEIIDTPYVLKILKVHCDGCVLDIKQDKLEPLVEYLNSLVKLLEDYDYHN